MERKLLPKYPTLNRLWSTGGDSRAWSVLLGGKLRICPTVIWQRLVTKSFAFCFVWMNERRNERTNEWMN